MKLIENKSDLSKLSTLSEPSIVKFIENQSEHSSKLTLSVSFQKNVLQGDVHVLVNRTEFLIFMQSIQFGRLTQFTKFNPIVNCNEAQLM